MIEDATCKCGSEMKLVRRESLRIGNDVWGIGGRVTFWLACPLRRWWSCWHHTAPVRQA